MTCGSHSLAAVRPTCRRLLVWSNHHNLFYLGHFRFSGIGVGRRETRRAHSVGLARRSRRLRWFTAGLPKIFLSRPEDAGGVIGHIRHHHMPGGFGQFAGQRLGRNDGIGLLLLPVIKAAAWLIVAAGKNAALPHHRPSDYIVQEGEPIVIDIGAKCEGYASDLTRTICLGKEDNRFRNIYDIVLKAQLSAEQQIVAGMTGSAADAIARDIISAAGYGSYYGHGLGHGVGLVIHEKPHVGVTSKDILADGMIFTVEPGIYLPDWGGVRIEDTVVMEHGKIRVLSASKK